VQSGVHWSPLPGADGHGSVARGGDEAWVAWPFSRGCGRAGKDKLGDGVARCVGLGPAVQAVQEMGHMAAAF
jgi:hypothetical protein